MEFVSSSELKGADKSEIGIFSSVRSAYHDKSSRFASCGVNLTTNTNLQLIFKRSNCIKKHFVYNIAKFPNEIF